MVDLVAGERHAQADPVGVPRCLSRSNATSRSSRPSRPPRCRARPRRRAGCGSVPQHLVAAADSEHGRPAFGVPDDGVGEARAPQPVQIGHRRLRSGQNDDVDVQQAGRLGHVPDGDARFAGQRLGVGRVGDPREPDDPHLSHFAARRGRPAEHAVGDGGQRVLGVQPQPVRPGQHAERRTAGERASWSRPGSSSRGSPRNLLITNPAISAGRPARGRRRAEQVREDAAPVDVADDEHRHLRAPRQAHVRQVGGPQVDLRRGAGALTDDDVVPPAARPRVRDDVGQRGRPRAVGRALTARPRGL